MSAERCKSGVSVVIPAFNSETTIAATLESVAAQTVSPVDVTVVDDASTDETAAIVRVFQSRLPQLNLLRLPRNSGVGQARQIGIAAGRGDLVALLDGDDIWHPSFVERMGDRMRAEPDCSLGYALSLRVDRAGRVSAPPEGVAVDGWAFYQLLHSNVIGNGSSAVFRRQILNDIGELEGRQLDVCDDLLRQLLAAWRGPIVCAPEYLVGYRDIATSLSKSSTRMVAGQIRLLETLERRLPEMRGEPFLWAKSIFFSRAAEASRRGEDGSLARSIGFRMRALAFDPTRVTAAAIRRLGSKLANEPERAATTESPLLGMDFLALAPAAIPLHPGKIGFRRDQVLRYDEAHGVARRAAQAPEV